MSQQAYVFEATLDDDPDVRRTVAVGSEQTLDDLHAVLRRAFEWHGDFPYTFRVGGALYTSPLTAEPGDATADVGLDRLGLQPEASITHVVEADDDWRIVVELVDVAPASDESLPRVIERQTDVQLEPEYDLGGGG